MYLLSFDALLIYWYSCLSILLVVFWKSVELGVSVSMIAIFWLSFMNCFIGKEMHCISCCETQCSLVWGYMVRTWANRSLFHRWKFGNWSCLARPSRVHLSVDDVARYPGLVLVIYLCAGLYALIVYWINRRFSLRIRMRKLFKFWCFDIYAVYMLFGLGRKLVFISYLHFLLVQLLFTCWN